MDEKTNHRLALALLIILCGAVAILAYNLTSTYLSHRDLLRRANRQSSLLADALAKLEAIRQSIRARAPAAAGLFTQAPEMKEAAAKWNIKGDLEEAGSIPPSAKELKERIASQTYEVKYDRGVPLEFFRFSPLPFDAPPAEFPITLVSPLKRSPPTVFLPRTEEGLRIGREGVFGVIPTTTTTTTGVPGEVEEGEVSPSS
jgi:hypothetical protein